jgi:hypothetical protein
MPRGGKREGAGRKPQLLRYDGESIGKRPLRVGQWCEEEWRKSYIGEKRPRTRKTIIWNAAEKFGLERRMVKRLWEDYRRFEVDTNPDNPDGD